MTCAAICGHKFVVLLYLLYFCMQTKDSDFMDIVNIEAATFDEIFEKVQSLCSFIESATKTGNDRMLGEWMDNQETCQMLGVSPRKLQYLRDSDKIAYTRIDRRIFYKKEDIMRCLNSHLQQIHK